MERIHDDVWKCGPFQIVHTSFLQLTRFVSVWSVYFMMFGNYDPGWKCLKYRDDSNTSFFSLTEHNISTHSRHSSKVQSLNETSTYQSVVNETERENMSKCEIYDLCDVIQFEPGSKTLVTEFHLICDMAYASSLIISVQMIGMLIGAVVSGQAGELFGRRFSLYGNVALCSLSNFLAIFSPSWQVYAIFMFFIGVACSGIMIIYGVYMMEFLESKWRGRLGSLPTWNLSFALFAVTTYVIRNWVYIHIFTASITAFALIGAFWTPESLRWLMVHGKDKKAGEVIEKIMRMNKRDNNIAEALEKLSSGKTDKPLDRKYTYLDLFRLREILFMTLKMSVNWFFILMFYFALSFSVHSLAGNFYINIIIAGLLEFPVVIMVGPLANLFGRRLPLAAFLVTSALGCIVIVVSYFTLAENTMDFVITYSALFAKSILIGALGFSILLCVELYPTAVRNLALAFLNFVSKAGSIVAPYIIPKDRHSLVIANAILAVVLILNVAVVVTLPETKNQSLQDHLRDESISESADE